MLSREAVQLRNAPTPDLVQTMISRYLLKLANSPEPALETLLRNVNPSNAKSPKGQINLVGIVRLGDVYRQVIDRFFSRGFQLEARPDSEKGLESRNQVLAWRNPGKKFTNVLISSKTKESLKLLIHNC